MSRLTASHTLKRDPNFDNHPRDSPGKACKKAMLLSVDLVVKGESGHCFHRHLARGTLIAMTIIIVVFDIVITILVRTNCYSFYYWEYSKLE